VNVSVIDELPIQEHLEQVAAATEEHNSFVNLLTPRRTWFQARCTNVMVNNTRLSMMRISDMETKTAAWNWLASAWSIFELKLLNHEHPRQ
jgi:hypothetical protein